MEKLCNLGKGQMRGNALLLLPAFVQLCPFPCQWAVNRAGRRFRKQKLTAPFEGPWSKARTSPPAPHKDAILQARLEIGCLRCRPLAGVSISGRGRGFLLKNCS